MKLRVVSFLLLTERNVDGSFSETRFAPFDDLASCSFFLLSFSWDFADSQY